MEEYVCIRIPYISISIYIYTCIHINIVNSLTPTSAYVPKHVHVCMKLSNYSKTSAHRCSCCFTTTPERPTLYPPANQALPERLAGRRATPACCRRTAATSAPPRKRHGNNAVGLYSTFPGPESMQTEKRSGKFRAIVDVLLRYRYHQP